MILATHILEVGGRTIDLVRGHVTGSETPTRLTSTELKLLSYLAARTGETVPREELYERVWGYKKQVQSRALDATLRRLRGKVEVDPTTPRVLITVPGEGYQFVRDFAPCPLSPTDSRVVLPAWRSDVQKLVAEARAFLRSGASDQLTATGIMALRTLARVGPREEGRVLAEDLLSASLEPWQRAWILAETLPLLKGTAFTTRSEEALGLAEAHGDPDLLAVVNLMSARGYNRVERLEVALELASKTGCARLRMRAIGQLATTLDPEKIKETHTLYLQAFELADVAANEWEKAVLDANYARFLCRVGATDEGAARLSAALEVFVAWEDRPNTVMSHLNLGVLDCRRNRFEAARESYRQGQVVAEQLGDRSLVVLCRLGELACGEQSLETLDQGEVDALLTECRLKEYRPEEAVALMLLGQTWQARGHLGLARAPMEKAIEVARRAAYASLAAECTGNLGLVLIESGEVEDGLALLRSSIVELLPSKDQDGPLAKFLLRWHLEVGPEVEPRFHTRLLALARTLPGPAGTPWEGLESVLPTSIDDAPA